MNTVIGWDIGGVNTKATLIIFRDGTIVQQKVASQYFEIWQNREALIEILRNLAEKLGSAEAMGVTMTAELSDAFRNKREGVSFILNCLEEAFPNLPLYVLDVSGKFVGVETAAQNPIQVAASNWTASALLVSQMYPNCLFVDIGTTSTDIIPIINGQIATRGRNDLTRLQAGELVYMGALRTNINTIVPAIPVNGIFCRTAAEYFAIIGDVHLILGNLSKEQYALDTPDRREKSREFALERLARLVCADTELLQEEEIVNMARYIQEKQIQLLTEAVLQVLSRFPKGYQLPMVTTGLGEFLAKKCALRIGLETISLEDQFGKAVSIAAPSFAVALLLSKKFEER